MLAQVLCGVASGEGLTWRCNVKKELRTEENLHAASYHLLYEMWMLQEIVRELSSTLSTGGELVGEGKLQTTAL